MSIERVKRIIYSKHFKGAMINLTLISCTIYLILTAFFISDKFKNETSRYEAEANNIVRFTENQFESISNQALFMGTLPSVNRALSEPVYSSDSYLSLAQDLSVLSSSPIIDSVYLINNEIERVYVAQRGMYGLDEFYDIDMIKQSDLGIAYRFESEYWLFDRSINPYYAQNQPTQVITHVRSLPLMKMNSIGSLVVNISEEKLAKSIAEFTAGQSDALIVTWNSTTLYQNSPQPISKYRFLDRWDITVNSTLNSGIHATIDIRAIDLLSSVRPQLGILCLSIFPTFLIMLFVSYVYSSRHLIPLDSLIQKLNENNSSSDLVSSAHDTHAAGRYNDYAFLEQAIEQVNKHIHNINSIVASNRHIIQEKLVIDLLCQANPFEERQAELMKYDIDLPSDSCSVILIDIPALQQFKNYSMKEEIKLLVKENSVEQFRSIGPTYAALIDRDQILILLNYSEQVDIKQNVMDICHSLTTGMEENLDVSLLFSIAFARSKDIQLFQAFSIARKNFLFTSNDAGGYIQFSTEDEMMNRVDLAYMTQSFVLNITSHKKAEMDSILDELVQSMDNLSISDQQNLLLQILCKISAELLDLELALDKKMLVSTLSSISDESSLSKMLVHFKRFINSPLKLDSEASEDANYYIVQCIAYIEDNYRNTDLSVPEIARHCSLNPVYLSRLFKLITGQTPSEFLNRHRIQVSLELLADHSLSINEISEIVGYADVRSYIRFFKKYYSTTPGKYRQQPIQSV